MTVLFCDVVGSTALGEATDPELQFRMQGIAFQGAFFKASPVMKQAGLEEATLFKAIEDQLKQKADQ